jgi:hypothetical protein
VRVAKELQAALAMAVNFLRRFIGKISQPSGQFEFIRMKSVPAILLKQAAQGGGTDPNQGRQ